jgi:signal transduction histidine kinase
VVRNPAYSSGIGRKELHVNGPETILVVDDEAIIRRSLRAYLEHFGFVVIEAKNGTEGLESCIREHPDLVLLDVNMPGMNGFAVCRGIKAHPDVWDTPVIYLSALVESADLLEAFGSGGVDYVSKPFRYEEVKARITTHLKLRRQKRQIEDDHKKLQEAHSEVRKEGLLLIELNERLRQTVAMKSHFIAHMRSEINDPLSAILGLAEELGEPRNKPDSTRALADRIKAEAFHLDFQLRNIFCAAELEAGDASPSIARVNLESVLLDVTVAFAAPIKEKAQTLELSVPPGMDPIPTDAAKLRIILANLLANALEFTPQGGRIELQIMIAGETLQIQVKDNGVGLSEAEVSVIFERFRQMETGHDRTHRGQGLGLSVVKALVELLDGRISVESEPGLGSTFSCQLPLHPQSGNPDSFACDGNLFIFDEPTEL